VRSIILGSSAAIVMAFTLIVPRVYGVSTWKYVLAAIGVTLFFLADRDGSTRT
jgi:hypothetical protein